MIFSHKNVLPRTVVYNGDRHQDIHRVVRIDVSTGEVVCVDYPAELDKKNGEFKSHSIKFEAIYPIYAGMTLPCMFLCYRERQQWA